MLDSCYGHQSLNKATHLNLGEEKYTLFLNVLKSDLSFSGERTAFNCAGEKGRRIHHGKLDVASNGSLYFQGCLGSSFPLFLSRSEPI